MGIKSLMTILVLSFLISCRSEDKGQLLTLEISKESIQNASSFQDFFSEPVYTPLETDDLALIGGINLLFFITPEHILSTDHMNVFVFKREDGTFLHKIGEIGHGPGEYAETLHLASFNISHASKVYCADFHGKLLQYNIDGQFEGKVPIPLVDNSSLETYSRVAGYTCLNDSVHCAYYSNMSGTEKKRLTLFSPTGEVYKVFPNTNIVDGLNGNLFGFAFDVIFYKSNQNTYFKESTNDTVFKVTLDSLKPHFQILKGEYSKHYRERYFGQLSPITQRSLWETDQYIYLLFSFFDKSLGLVSEYILVYNKTNKSQEIYKIDALKETSKSLSFSQGNDQRQLNIEFPHFSSGYLVSSLSALGIRDYFGDDIYPENWKNVKEEDNPVFVYWKLP